MSGTTLDLDQLLHKDNLAVEIANKWRTWNNLRQNKIAEWVELRKYIFATDTTQTTNAQLPWKNKTTTPKLTQIRDNLYANYMKSLFPNRHWLEWEAFDRKSGQAKKAKSIKTYMNWIVERSGFKEQIGKLLLDYIDYGNAFGTVEWVDERQEIDQQMKVGYVGPRVKRISPYEIVFNPTAPNFASSPKIIQMIISLGELKEYLTRMTSDDNRQEMEDLFNYLKDLRDGAGTFEGELDPKDDLYRVDGFTSFRQYLESQYVEVLFFFGDLYDIENDKFYRNHVIAVCDRHKIISNKPNPSYFGTPPIYHVGWRIRQDNLWAMGPLDNLVGMQYRIDHLENLKADLFDLTAFPPLKITGYVDDFVWGPFEKIHVSEEGNVEILSPDVNALNTDIEIQYLTTTMEEMAGSPKEAMGFRTPGEKTKFEVQRLENAASRIFQSKIEQFENEVLEPILNAMLELSKRHMPSQEVGVFDEEFNVTTFKTLTSQDITGYGRIRPVAAKHFAEKAEKIQNLTGFLSSAPGQDQSVMVHFSGLKMAAMYQELLELEGYDLVTPFVRITEMAEGQRVQNSADEQTMMEIDQPTGLAPDDFTNTQNTSGMGKGRGGPAGVRGVPQGNPQARPQAT